MKRAIPNLTFRKRNLGKDYRIALSNWNAQLVLTCYDPWVRFSMLPDDLIIILNDWLKAAIIGRINPALPDDPPMRPLTFKYKREIRLSTFADMFMGVTPEWLSNIDYKDCPTAYTYQDYQTGKDCRVARFIIKNNDRLKFKRLQSLIMDCAHMYENFVQRFRVLDVFRHTVTFYGSADSSEDKTSFNTPLREFNEHLTVIYILIAPDPELMWKWKDQSSLGGQQDMMWRQEHETAKKLGSQIYDIMQHVHRNGLAVDNKRSKKAAI